MAWLPVSLPDSAEVLLNKTGVKGFSKPQTLAAVLDWFLRLPLSYQAQVARDYAEHIPAGNRGGGRPGQPPSRRPAAPSSGLNARS
jgi:hypothetical protein